MPRRLAGLLLPLVGLAGCVGPARTPHSYQKKAGHSAQEALSAVETARLGAQAGSEGKAYAPYLSVLLADAERTATTPPTRCATSSTAC